MLDFDGVELSDEVKQSLVKQVEEKTACMVSKEDFEAVKAKADELLTEAKKAKEQKRIEKEEKEMLKQEAAAKNGDVESLQAVIERQKQEMADYKASISKKEETNSIKAVVNHFLSENVVADPAARLYMENKLSARLGYKEGQVMPVNEDGSLSGVTLSELVQSLVGDQSNAPYMLASKATGGGAAGSQQSNGGAVDLSKLNKTELSIYARENPVKYQEWQAKQH